MVPAMNRTVHGSYFQQAGMCCIFVHATLIKKENQIFLIYKEIQSGAVAKPYMRKGFLIYEEMSKYFPIYEKAVSHICMTLQLLCSILNFLIYEENLIFFWFDFISVLHTLPYCLRHIGNSKLTNTRMYILKVLVASSFCLFSIILLAIHSFIHQIRRRSTLVSSLLSAPWATPPPKCYAAP